MALVSIIVPVYNVELYLEQCVKSILNQTLTDIEVILVNDGSTDSSGDICKYFADLDSRVVYVEQLNGGLSMARNTGIKNSTAEFLAFVDSDDWIAHDMVEQLYIGCKENGAEISCCGRFYEYPDYKYTQYSLESKKVYTQEEALKHMLKGDTIDVACWDKIFSRRLFDVYKFPRNEIHEDMAIMFDIFLRVETVVHVGKALYHYRQRALSITKQKFTAKSLVILKHIKHVKVLLKNHLALKSHVAAFYYRMLKNTCTIYLNSNGESELYNEFRSLRAELKRDLGRILLNKELTIVEKLSIVTVLSPFYGIVKQGFIAVTHKIRRKAVS